MKRICILCLLVFFCAPVVHAQTAIPAPAIRGVGTPGAIPKFTGKTTIGNSIMTESAGGITVSGQLDAAVDFSGGFALHAINYASSGGMGILGVTVSPDGFGVRGQTAAPSGGTGVLGEGYPDGNGVIGISENGVGIRGQATGNAGTGIGVLGEAYTPNATAGVFNAIGGGTLLIGIANNTANVFRVDIAGKVFANGGFEASGADFAESMPVTGDRSRYEPGDLLVIDRTSNRRLTLANNAYSTLVAGIYSTKPGVLASPYSMDDPSLAKEVPMAVVGIVPCKVSAENGAIEVGDLLVASSTPGHAMKGSDRGKMLGAVVGKALEPLREGRGVVQVLVTLQ